MPIFDEDNTIEQMAIQALANAGWTYIPADQLPRDFSDILIESKVKEALIRLNPCIEEDPSRADEVIYKLRSLILTVQPNNLVAQNERFKRLVFEENSFPFGKDGRMVSIKFFGTSVDGDLDKNEYIVTNQWWFPVFGEGGKRLDMVLLINGFPVCVGEFKTPVRAAITWLDGAGDILDYEIAIPQMFVTNILNFATEGKRFRYGAISAQPNFWMPWHTPDHKTEGTLADVKISMEAMLTPANVMDIFEFYTLFATDKHHRKYKIVCRYQQFEGANMIIQRVLENKIKKGLIWHFQGSGKTLLMIFAAQKLRMLPQLKNPTVAVVDDRISLESAMNSNFDLVDIPNVTRATSKKELIDFFEGDTRKILVTTIFKFGEVDRELNPRDNIIVMVDEAHRTQEGDLGAKMRLALPNAFFFGLTGTPINRLDHNTFVTFGATEDKTGYMSKYGFSDSIRDGATLPLHFETVPVELHIDQDRLDAEFDELSDGLSDSQKAEVSDRIGIKALFESPKRIAAVCKHISEHYKAKIEPNGYKAMVVCYNRELCLLYEAELKKYFKEEELLVDIDTNDDKRGIYRKYRMDRDQEEKQLDRFRDPNSRLKILIVTSKLLTGFDAPILQVMYLDKPMKNHTLLQAICRTNRTYDDGKSFGLIVDYVGLFDNVAKSLDFDEASMRKIISNIDEVKKQFPALQRKCLAYFMGVDRTVQGWEGLMAAQDALPDNRTKDMFAADYRVLNRAWNALSPDPFLNAYRFDYEWLSRVYESVKPTDGTGALVWATLGPKTTKLVHENISVVSVREDPDIIEINPELIEGLTNEEERKRVTKKVEINLVARIHAHSDDPRFKKIGEKLEELRRKHEQGLINSIEFLKQLLELAKDAAAAEKEAVPEDQHDKGVAALTALFDGVKNKRTPIIVERVVKDIDDIVKIVRFDGWQDTTAGRQEVKKALRSIIWIKYKIKDLEVFEKAYKYIEQYY